MRKNSRSEKNMHTLEVADVFVYLGNMAFLLGVGMGLIAIGCWISTYEELYTKSIASIITVILVVISCICYYKSVKLSTPVEVKKNTSRGINRKSRSQL